MADLGKEGHVKGGGEGDNLVRGEKRSCEPLMDSAGRSRKFCTKAYNETDEDSQRGDQRTETTPQGTEENPDNPTGVNDVDSGFISSPVFRNFTYTVLGQGGFGKVLLVTESTSGDQFALKMIKKQNLIHQSLAREGAMVESRILRITNACPFLIRGLAAIQTSDSLLLLMEYARGGDLQYLLGQRHLLDIRTATFYAAEIICAIQFLHVRGYVHRDIKPQNILLDAEGHIKVADFGMALENMFGDQMATQAAGTIGYIAPEMELGLPYNAAVDWYSFGVVLYQMTTGRSPYLHPQYEGLEDTTADIIKKLLLEDTSRRLGVNGNIRQHPFFCTIDWVALEHLQLQPPMLDDQPLESTPTGEISLLPSGSNTPIAARHQELFRGFSFFVGVHPASS